MTGGADADTFRFYDTRGSGNTITDFTGEDVIDLAFIDADPSAAGNQGFHFGRTDARIGDVIYRYDAANDRTIVTLFTDADQRPDGYICLTGRITLSSEDFLF